MSIASKNTHNHTHHHKHENIINHNYYITNNFNENKSIFEKIRSLVKWKK